MQPPHPADADESDTDRTRHERGPYFARTRRHPRVGCANATCRRRGQPGSGPDRRRSSPQPGGCPFFAALALRLLAREGQIVTRCSDRERCSSTARCALSAFPSRCSPPSNGGFDHVYEDEIRTTTVTSIGEPWTPRDAVHLDPSVTWVHVAPLLRSDFPAETLAALAAGGRRLSLDAQGLVREARLGPLEQRRTSTRPRSLRSRFSSSRRRRPGSSGRGL